MDFLRGIAAAAIQSTGVTFPFSVGDRISNPGDGGRIWEIREGVKKDDQTPLTLFIFDLTLPPLQPGNRDRKHLFNLAKNALKKLRTIRHPDILKYIDSVETDTTIYIATERVQPLERILSQWDAGHLVSGSASDRKRGKEEWIAWGIKSLGTAVAFLNAPPLSLHHAALVPGDAVFVTPALEFRLGGFELLTGMSDEAGILWGMGGLMGREVGERSAPEVGKSGWVALRGTDPSIADTYLLALLIFSLYNPSLPLPPLSTAPQPSSIGAMPRSIFPVYKRMLNPNPKTRLPTTQFLDEVEKTGFWNDNALLELVEGLDGFELASEAEKVALLKRIKDSIGTLPAPFLVSRILPSLLHSLSLPAAPSSAILPIVLRIGKDLPIARYGSMILEPVIKLYAIPDRGTRMALLDGLSEYGEQMDKPMVARIWTHLITGFTDTVAVIREATVKAIPIIAPKLSDRLLNNDLLRHLARMQVDPEPSIRTNTCILLGRLAPLLGPNTKKKVLIPAFARSLKDGFVHARVAGLMALMATVDFYDTEDLAGRVIPNMSFTLVDKEKLVRDQAFKAMTMFVGRIEIVAASMPETALIDKEGNAIPAAVGPSTTTMVNGSGQASLANTATGAAGALAGWAIASLGKQLPSGQAHTMLSAASLLIPQAQSSGSSPIASPRISNDGGLRGAVTPSQSSQIGSAARSSTSSPNPGSSRPSKAPVARQVKTGMQLGSKSTTSKAGSTTLVDVLAGEYEEDGDEVANAWGQDDLIDVNADEDDWAGFEEAPAPTAASKHAPAKAKPTRSQAAAPRIQPSVKAPVDDHRTSISSSQASYPSPPSPPYVPGPSIDDPWADQSGVTAHHWQNAAPSPVVSNYQSAGAWGHVIDDPPTPIVSNTATNGWGSAVDDPPSAMPSAFASPEPEKVAAAPPLSALSKEDKDKEMARRREERAARIAAMKASKKK